MYFNNNFVRSGRLFIKYLVIVFVLGVVKCLCQVLCGGKLWKSVLCG